jgi:CheY-like chemotaxis protein
MSKKNVIPVDILLVEDNPGDIRLTQEALQEEKIINKIYIAKDGIEAMQFLHKENPFSNVPTPDIIMLDLNLPRKDGREVLVEIKNDPYLKHIPVIILTSSQAEKDVAMSYNLYANCYIVKPINLDGLWRLFAVWKTSGLR